MAEAGGREAQGDPASEFVASVDLGSNSFHMVIARVVGPGPVIIDRLREQVQLGAGLDADRRLGEEAQTRALECLQRFNQRLRAVPDVRLRAVGTNTLRVARNAREFLGKAEEALGHPIEVINGPEEARLVYLGVAHTLADTRESRLVVDIGGGSTECILGEQFEALEAHSFFMGCINHTRRFFEDGSITKKRWAKAVMAARLELQTIESRFRSLGWGSAVGASGTIRATDSVLRANGWGDGGITTSGIRQLGEALSGSGIEELARLPGLKPDRASVFPGGVTILEALFESLGIERMVSSWGALREGVLFDLLGRIEHEDVRERTIRALQDRFDVDLTQAHRVRRTALYLMRQVAGAWDLVPEEAEQYLDWASELHEIGLVIAYRHHHRHGAYILENADLPGFSNDDKQVLAAMVGNQRRRIQQDLLVAVPSPRSRPAMRLAVILRLAVLLNRSRSTQPPSPVRLDATPEGLALTFPTGWIEDHPLTVMDLEEERGWLRGAGMDLQVGTTPPSGRQA